MGEECATASVQGTEESLKAPWHNGPVTRVIQILNTKQRQETRQSTNANVCGEKEDRSLLMQYPQCCIARKESKTLSPHLFMLLPISQVSSLNMKLQL
jgi:hypothetical protein